MSYSGHTYHPADMAICWSGGVQTVLLLGGTVIQRLRGTSGSFHLAMVFRYVYVSNFTQTLMIPSVLAIMSTNLRTFLLLGQVAEEANFRYSLSVTHGKSEYRSVTKLSCNFRCRVLIWSLISASLQQFIISVFEWIGRLIQTKLSSYYCFYISPIVKENM